MVNYQDPVTIETDFTALVKFWHVVLGIFIWEFVTTLSFEWDFIRGHRPYRWTIWIYTIARLSMLYTVINSVIMGFDISAPINCQFWITSGLVNSYISFATSSLLIALRVIAIWKKNMIIIGITMAILITDVGFQINGCVRVRSTWSPEAGVCSVQNIEATKPNVATSLATDVVLLLIMLIGLFRERLRGGGAFALGRTLWNQGLIWLLVATAAEVPSTVLLFLNLNGPLTLIVLLPSNVTVTIAATRMYRLLVEFGSEFSTDASSGSGRTLSVPGMRKRRKGSGPIQLNRMEVSVRTDREQYPMSQMSGVGSFVITDPKEHYKHEVSKVNLGGDV